MDFVEALRRRVGEFSSELRRDRELVKSALVEPFLRLMGWDPEDPKDVRRREGGFGQADYILFADGEPIVSVAVGAMGEVPKPSDYFEDCKSVGAKCLLVTDGDRWEAYGVNGEALAAWSLSAPIEQLFKEIDGFRKILGLESGKYEELVCYTRWNKREIRITALEDPEGLLVRRTRSGIPYSHIAQMLLEGKIVFLSGGGVDRRNIHYIKKRLEKEVGGGIECLPAIYNGTMGYTLALKKKQKKKKRG